MTIGKTSMHMGNWAAAAQWMQTIADQTETDTKTIPADIEAAARQALQCIRAHLDAASRDELKDLYVHMLAAENFTVVVRDLINKRLGGVWQRPVRPGKN